MPAPRDPYWLHVSIGFDQFVQSLLHFGRFGITISSRAGTAAAHGHRWGKIMWWLLDHTWPFGRDADGTSHCKSAILHDIERLKAALDELQDPVVTQYLETH